MATEVGAAALDEALLAALAPRDLAERVRGRLLGGLSARQVYERLDEATRAALRPAGLAPVAAELRAVEAVAARLRALAERGRVARRASELRQDMRVKGARAIEIDLFRLPAGASRSPK